MLQRRTGRLAVVGRQGSQRSCGAIGDGDRWLETSLERVIGLSDAAACGGMIVLADGPTRVRVPGRTVVPRRGQAADGSRRVAALRISDMLVVTDRTY